VLRELSWPTPRVALEPHSPAYYMGVKPDGPRLAFFDRQAGSTEPPARLIP
jgi:hypothetical protein